MANYRKIAREYIKEVCKMKESFELWKGYFNQENDLSDREPFFFSVCDYWASVQIGFRNIAVLESINELDCLLENVDKKLDFQCATKDNVQVTEYKGFVVVTYITPLLKMYMDFFNNINKYGKY